MSVQPRKIFLYVTVGGPVPNSPYRHLLQMTPRASVREVACGLGCHSRCGADGQTSKVCCSLDGYRPDAPHSFFVEITFPETRQMSHARDCA